jgi:endo-1,4-beta-xylanase
MKSHLISVLTVTLALVGPLLAADSTTVIPLWPEGAPGSAARRHEPEKVAGTNISNIHHPSLIT